MFNFKELLRKIGLKIAGEKPPAEKCLIKIYKNSIEFINFDSTMSNISAEICKLIECFARFTKYEIIYDFPKREIIINFIVKKALEDKNNKEEK